MNKKKTLSKAFKKAGLKSDPFKIVDSKHKKKAKAVKTNIKQVFTCDLTFATIRYTYIYLADTGQGQDATGIIR